MASAAQNQFSGPVSVFQEQRLPETARPAGYSALIDAYGLEVPLPRTLCAIGAHHRMLERDGWRIMTPRHAPAASLEGHLTFALKYEGLDLALLKSLFVKAGPDPIKLSRMISRPVATPGASGSSMNGLSEKRWTCPTPGRENMFPVLDPDLQWGIEGETVPRYRLRNNLPGTPEFCPLVFRTAQLDGFIAEDLAQRARDIVADVPRDVLARTAAFLLLKDSKSSYAIEGESPPQDRIQRWGRAIGEAGKQPLDEDELLRLQRIVIGDARFIKLGFRDEGGFVGEHDRESRLPLPDHISARPEDLQSLLAGMIAFDHGPAQSMDAVIAAAILAFGFVYIHPFEDGNGRLHRYLIHHVLAERGYNPPGVIFPVSAAILDQIDRYRATLESYSQRLLPHIRWEPTEKFNARILNNTGDFYRFFDATPHAEFLYECVKRTIEHDLPYETGFLRRYDEFRRRVEGMIDMPERTVDLLFRFLGQNEGKLSNRARTKEFDALTEKEVERIEEIYVDTFSSL